MKHILLMVAVVASVAQAADKPVGAIASTSPDAGVGLPLVSGGAYMVQCTTPAHVRACGGQAWPDGGYSTGQWTLDAGDTWPDGGPSWVGPSCLARTTDPLFPARSLVPVQLGISENHLSVLARTGTTSCAQFTTTPAPARPPVFGGAVFPSQGPDGYRRPASGIVRMTNLAAAGSTGYKLTATCYECEVADESVNICYSLTCTDAGGIPMGTGSRRKVCFDHTTDGGADGGATQDVSGWSTSATGDWNCTPIN